jgi:hypothetical protein
LSAGGSLGDVTLKEGKTLETDVENLAELNEQAGRFEKKQVPVLKALGMV